MDLLEREPCFAELAKWLDTATQQGGGVVLLSGEAGIGKTVLLREFVCAPAVRPAARSKEPICAGHPYFWPALVSCAGTPAPLRIHSAPGSAVKSASSASTKAVAVTMPN